ncbi:hypothetical protein VIGAN_07139900 [Vigna angularis var. angularis]|uniref:BAH domain-containing protein n=1 Tax=Vigna angularis var. angularis TaxID=157739 RepID=A0A0S3SIE8_PHAAN|nr:hypothetical protein VIGAN_07139900 [Vigna angularis var. angularis]
MSKTKSSKKDLNSYTIKGTNKIVRVGDHVTMRPPDTNKAPYVARVEKIEPCRKNDVKVHVRWYYRPEDSIEGRRRFHGVKELFLSDHYDVQSAHAIEGKCVVHSFKNYTKLQDVAAEDYYYRFEYEAATGTFTPDRVVVNLSSFASNTSQLTLSSIPPLIRQSEVLASSIFTSTLIPRATPELFASILIGFRSPQHRLLSTMANQ